MHLDLTHENTCSAKELETLQMCWNRAAVPKLHFVPGGTVPFAKLQWRSCRSWLTGGGHTSQLPKSHQDVQVPPGEAGLGQWGPSSAWEASQGIFHPRRESSQGGFIPCTALSGTAQGLLPVWHPEQTWKQAEKQEFINVSITAIFFAVRIYLWLLSVFSPYKQVMDGELLLNSKTCWKYCSHPYSAEPSCKLCSWVPKKWQSPKLLSLFSMGQEWFPWGCRAALGKGRAQDSALLSSQGNLLSFSPWTPPASRKGMCCRGTANSVSPHRTTRVYLPLHTWHAFITSHLFLQRPHRGCCCKRCSQ